MGRETDLYVLAASIETFENPENARFAVYSAISDKVAGRVGYSDRDPTPAVRTRRTPSRSNQTFYAGSSLALLTRTPRKNFNEKGRAFAALTLGETARFASGTLFPLFDWLISRAIRSRH